MSDSVWMWEGRRLVRVAGPADVAAQRYVAEHQLTQVTVDHHSIVAKGGMQYETYSVIRADPLFPGSLLARFLVVHGDDPPQV